MVSLRFNNIFSTGKAATALASTGSHAAQALAATPRPGKQGRMQLLPHRLPALVRSAARAALLASSTVVSSSSGRSLGTAGTRQKTLIVYPRQRQPSTTAGKAAAAAGRQG